MTRIRKILQARNCNPIAPGRSQYKASFAAGRSLGTAIARRREMRKSFVTLGAGAASIFPFGVDDLREPMGYNSVATSHTGLLNVASPFKRGIAPHLITFGVSRSGKTFWASMAYIYWYLQRDDRTLIVCDTQRGFEGLTKLLGGSTSKSAETTRQINPMAMEQGAAAQFFAGILQLAGSRPVGLPLGNRAGGRDDSPALRDHEISLRSTRLRRSQRSLISSKRCEISRTRPGLTRTSGRNLRPNSKRKKRRRSSTSSPASWKAGSTSTCSTRRVRESRPTRE